MDKRTFLKTSSALVSGAMLSPLMATSQGKKSLTNWAGNLTYHTNHIHVPNSVEELQELVKKCTKVRALGSRHSFNTIADSNQNLISTSALNKIISLDKELHTVTVEGGIKYGELCQYLHENGFALHNLASLPHISIAGACATATHGSGVNNGNLATSVTAVEFVNAAGEIIGISRKDGDHFNGVVVSLGALGIATRITLDLVPTFNMQQVVYRNLSMQELKNNFGTIMAGGYSVSLFTDWKNKNINEVWIKSRVDGAPGSFPQELHGAILATTNMHPVEKQPAENCTEQMGIPGPWFERMPHFKMGFTPSTGKELQAEYFVPLEHGYDALMAVEQLHAKITPHLFISEIRTVAADNLWMSPNYKKPCVAIHTTWKQEWKEVMQLLPLVEKQLAPFQPRPHWAKLFTLGSKQLQSGIERLADFKELMHQYDPHGKFRNKFLDQHLFGG